MKEKLVKINGTLSKLLTALHYLEIIEKNFT